MDSEWLAEANAVLDKYEKDPSRAWTATDVLATRAEGKPGAATQLPCRDDPDTLHSLKRFCYYVSPAGKMDISDDSDAEWADGSSDQLLGKPRPRLGGLYQLPHPDCVSLHRVLRV